MTWALMPLQKYAVFSGRSRRKEYWVFFLFTAIITIVLGIVDIIIGTYNDQVGVGLLQGLFYLAIFVPYIALSARRLHDIGKSGWFQLLFIIPLVGLILWIIWTVKDGDYDVNRYGPNPKTLDILQQGRSAPA